MAIKDSWLWEESDLLRLIVDAEKESLTLDYKECPSLQKTDGKKAEISKHVSSFANSQGGIIVYGMKENGHVPIALDTGFEPNEISKEWLEQVINSTIQPRIDGIRINQIELTTQFPKRVAYSVYIPQSTRCHMASDHRYYKRFNFQSVPMEDYEVRDVMNRSESPHLYLGFNIPSFELTYSAEDGLSELKELTGFIANSHPAPADSILVKLYIDSRVRQQAYGTGFERGVEGVLYMDSEDNGRESMNVVSWQMNWGPNSHMPVWAGVNFNLFNSKSQFNLRFPKYMDRYILGWTVDSPRMAQTQGLVHLVSNTIQLSCVPTDNQITFMPSA